MKAEVRQRQPLVAAALSMILLVFFQATTEAEQEMLPGGAALDLEAEPDTKLFQNKVASVIQNGKVVMFEASHNQDPYSDCSYWIQDLEAAGYTILVNTEPLSLQSIGVSDVLIIPVLRHNGNINSPYTASEAQIITQYVSNGGGMMLLADRGAYSTYYAWEIALAFGVTLNGDNILEAPLFDHDNFDTGHPIMAGINSVRYNWYTTMVPGTASPLIWEDDGDAVAVTFTVGSGRGAIFGDCNWPLSVYNNYSWADNSLLAIQTVEWLAGPAQAATIYVATSGEDTTGDGSEGNPYRTIQKGIDEAIAGDTVLVADGVYTGAGNRDLDFNGKAITVTSKNGAEATIIDCEATSGDKHRGFYFHSGETLSSVLDGFTIRNGYGPFEPFSGGTFSVGGGIYCTNSSPMITNNIITGNSAYGGGGIQCWENSSPTIANNVITGNSSSDAGGGIWAYKYSSATIINNTITENVAGWGGGGVKIDMFSSAKIINNVIAENSCGHKGGGIYCGNSSPTIINNTITRNNSQDEGGGTYFWHAFPTIANTILWSNTPEEIAIGAGSSISIAYSDIQGSWEGEGNIDADPQFVDSAVGDYHLTGLSPCIGAGTSNGAPATDIEGNPRGTPPDMGAYENSLDEPLPIIRLAFPNGGEVWRGGSSQEVTWEGPGPIDHVLLLYSTDGGNTYPNTIIASTMDDGIYEWDPVPSLDSATVRVKAIAQDSSNNGLADDKSDADFTIDSTPPETTLALSGTAGEDDWWTSDVTVELAATDILSGIKETDYRINGGAWEVYSSPFAVTGSTVYYYSEDNAGNIEAEQSIEIKIDKAAPETNVVSLSGTMGENQWYISNVIVELAATDSVSGVRETEYKIGNGDWQTYPEGGLTATATPVYYKSEDNAGNVEAERTLEIKMDTSKPPPPIVTDDGGHTNSTTQLHAWWTSGDTESGIERYEYTIGTSSGEDDVVNWTSEDVIMGGSIMVDEIADWILDEDSMIDLASMDGEVTVTNLSLVNGAAYYFSVRAKNNAGSWSDIGVSDGIVVNVSLEQRTLHLYPGMNLISICLDTGNTDISSVLEPIEGLYTIVWSYDASSGNWRRHVPEGDPLSNDLSTIESGKAYAISMVEEAVLTITGTQIADTTIQLFQGWNFAGYNSTRTQPREVALVTIADICVCIWTYNNQEKSWSGYIPDVSDAFNSLIELGPDRAHWIYLEEDRQWRVSP